VKAIPYASYSVPVADGVEAQVVIWELPVPVRGSEHGYKYRLALIVESVCVLRYDNEAGKGDHKHLGNRELPYDFRSVEDLQVDFWKDVEEWLKRRM
jgi:hypothetical protein